MQVTSIVAEEPNDTTPDWRFDTAAAVLYVEGPDKKMKDYTRVRAAIAIFVRLEATEATWPL